MYEKATLFGRSVKPPLMTRVPLMEQVHREARLIGLERQLRLDELRRLLKLHAYDPRYFRQRSEWRREQIRLLEQF